MHNFFINSEQFKENKAIITGNDFNHIKNVLRMKIKDKLYVCDKQNGESFLAEIEDITNDSIICSTISKNDSTESKIKVTLFQGIPKSDKMETIIQKSVELGVYEIIPVEMKYCIAKVKDENKILRWNKISEAAAKQSKRNIIPEVKNVVKISDICSKIKNYDISIVAFENEKEYSIKDILRNNKEKINSIAIIIGPEGGFSKEEVLALEENGARAVSLGKRILRTETAPITLLSMIMYEFEL